MSTTIYAPQGNLVPGSWDKQVINALPFSSVIISCIDAPSVAYAVEWSPNNANWLPCKTIDILKPDLGFTSSISAIGAYNVPGFGYVRISGGTGGTFTYSCSTN